MFNRTSFKKRILFVGIPDMAYIGLDGLLMSGVNIVGVLGPKKDHNMYTDFKNFVQVRGLNYIEYDNLDDSFLIEKIKKLDVDVAVVCSFNYKIPKVLMEATKDGFINVAGIESPGLTSAPAIAEYAVSMLRDCGFECLDSQSNFIFAKHNKIPAEQLYLRLKEQGILIRYFNKPRIRRCTG